MLTRPFPYYKRESFQDNLDDSDDESEEERPPPIPRPIGRPSREEEESDDDYDEQRCENIFTRFEGRQPVRPCWSSQQSRLTLPIFLSMP